MSSLEKRISVIIALAGIVGSFLSWSLSYAVGPSVNQERISSAEKRIESVEKYTEKEFGNIKDTQSHIYKEVMRGQAQIIERLNQLEQKIDRRR